MENKHGFGKWSGHIRVEFIPHDQQRYDTCGDWQLLPVYKPDPDLCFRISDTGNPDMNFVLFMHELTEALTYLYKHNFSVSAIKDVDKFDKDFIDDQIVGEAGFDPLAPYYCEHMLAMAIEHLIAAELNIDWNDYTEIVGSLKYLKNGK